MADLEKYRECIRQLITEYAELISSNNEIEAQTIFDREKESLPINIYRLAKQA